MQLVQLQPIGDPPLAGIGDPPLVGIGDPPLAGIEDPFLLGKLFFQLDEAVEMLMASSSPLFIATLLQLSKKIRLHVWQFLIDYDKCNFKWVDDFSAALWKYRKKRPKHEVTYYNLHPCFMISNQFKPKVYHIAKILIDCTKTELTDVLVGGNYAYIKGTTESYPGWEVEHNIELYTLFEWYFVACALSIRIDKMVLHNALNRYKDVPMIPHDETLCIK